MSGRGIRRAAVWTLALSMCLTVAGCSSKFTRPNYETIHRGMTGPDVRDRIGEPDRIEGQRWLYWRKRPYRHAVIEFQAGKVESKQWYYQPPVGETEADRSSEAQ